MKLSDSTRLVLKSKDENTVLLVAPDQSVHKAIENMAEHDSPRARVAQACGLGPRYRRYISQQRCREKRCGGVYSCPVLVTMDLAGVLRISPMRKRSVSSARRWLEAFRLSTNCELMDGCARTT